MKTRVILLLAALTMVLGNVWAQGPNNSKTYYQAADGKKGMALKTAMHGIISSNGFKVVGYDGLWEAYKKTDTRADGYVRDWYSNTTNYRHITDKAGSYKGEGDCYNREHSVPQSWFSKASPMKSDIVHVLPTDGYVNNQRSSYPFGEVSSATYKSNNDYCRLGSCKTEGYSGKVFEPANETKGDLARIYFYMTTCYEGKCESWSGGVFSSKNGGLVDWTLNMMLRWAQEDPVDEREIERNLAVYDVQKNRNPFVDYPGLEQYIWGDKKDQAFSYDHYDGGAGGDTPGGDVVVVAMPVISPDEGTYYQDVTIEISCATEGAEIYYTTGGADASEASTLYTGPFTLTETSTVKTVAIKDGKSSSQAIATYIIVTGGDDGDDDTEETPTDASLALNNEFFGYEGSGVVGGSSNSEDMVGKSDGITVTYALGTYQQRYLNATEIRLYNGNKVTVSVSQGTLQEIAFTNGSKQGKPKANTGSMNDLTWTGETNKVEFTSTSTISLSSMKVKVKTDGGATEIHEIGRPSLSGQRVIYNLRGQRVAHPSCGLYIVDGKKIYIK